MAPKKKRPRPAPTKTATSTHAGGVLWCGPDHTTPQELLNLGISWCLPGPRRREWQRNGDEGREHETYTISRGWLGEGAESAHVEAAEAWLRQKFAMVLGLFEIKDGYTLKNVQPGTASSLFAVLAGIWPSKLQHAKCAHTGEEGLVFFKRSMVQSYEDAFLPGHMPAYDRAVEVRAFARTRARITHTYSSYRHAYRLYELHAMVTFTSYFLLLTSYFLLLHEA